jgi:hypothetical protein
MCLDECAMMCEPACEPGPPSCASTCHDDAQAVFDACAAAGPDPAAPCAAIDPLRGCEIERQTSLTECLYGAGGCHDPGLDCHFGCEATAYADAIACLDEPLCQDPALCDAQWHMTFMDCVTTTCVPGGGGCDERVETMCPDGSCVPIGVACPPAPPTCEEMCPPGDPICGADCCVQTQCMPGDVMCEDNCCFEGCWIAFPEDPEACISTQCLVP